MSADMEIYEQLRRAETTDQVARVHERLHERQRQDDVARQDRVVAAAVRCLAVASIVLVVWVLGRVAAFPDSIVIGLCVGVAAGALIRIAAASRR